MTIIDLSHRFNKELLTTNVGKLLIYENPKMTIKVNRELSIVTHNSLFSKAIFINGDLKCISRIESNNYQNINKIVENPKGYTIYAYSHNINDDDSSKFHIITDKEREWNFIFDHNTHNNEMINKLLSIFKREIDKILNPNMCYVLTLQHPELDSCIKEPRIYIMETYIIKGYVATMIDRKDYDLEKRIQKYKEQHVVSSIIQYPNEIAQYNNIYIKAFQTCNNVNGIIIYHNQGKKIIQNPFLCINNLLLKCKNKTIKNKVYAL